MIMMRTVGIIISIISSFLILCIDVWAQAGSISPGRWPFERDGLWGYIDSTGKEVIAPRFWGARTFHSGVGLIAEVLDSGMQDTLRFLRLRFRYISSNGAPADISVADTITEFFDPRPVQSPKTTTAVMANADADSGGRTLPFQQVPVRKRLGLYFQSMRWSRGLNRTWQTALGAAGFKDVPIPIGLTDIMDRRGFRFSLSANDSLQTWLLSDKGVITKLPAHFLPESFSQGMAYFETNGKIGYLDSTGKVQISPHFLAAGPFSESIAPVSTDGILFGYINTAGKYVIQPDKRYTNLAAADNRIAFLEKELYGFSDKNGKVVIAPAFAEVNAFAEGLAAVRRGADTLMGFIDVSGKMVIRPAFSRAEAFYRGVAQVEWPDRSWGYINKSGKTLWRSKALLPATEEAP
jgi:hypothetical protein